MGWIAGVPAARGQFESWFILAVIVAANNFDISFDTSTLGLRRLLVSPHGSQETGFFNRVEARGIFGLKGKGNGGAAVLQGKGINP